MKPIVDSFLSQRNDRRKRIRGCRYRNRAICSCFAGLLTVSVSKHLVATVSETFIMSFNFPVRRDAVHLRVTANLKCLYYRLLGPLERQIVMNLLWLDSAIPASTVVAWITREGRKYVLLPQGCNAQLLTDLPMI